MLITIYATTNKTAKIKDPKPISVTPERDHKYSKHNMDFTFGIVPASFSIYDYLPLLTTRAERVHFHFSKKNNLHLKINYPCYPQTKNEIEQPHNANIFR